MKLRVTFDYEIPEALESLFENANPVESADNLFINELKDTGKFEGEFSIEHAEIIE